MKIMATSAVVAGEEKKKKGGELEATFVNKHRMIDA